VPEGVVTRIEITFEKYYQELLCSRDHDSLIQEAAQRILTGFRWFGSYDAYKETTRRRRFYSGAGFRKNCFMDIMNLIVEEVPRCGLGMPYTHQFRYSRYHYDSSEWSPDKHSEDRSSKLDSRDSETPEGTTSQHALLAHLRHASILMSIT
jgi:hypothetical protein